MKINKTQNEFIEKVVKTGQSVNIDNVAPTVTDNYISITSSGSGTGGVDIIDDTITVQWDNTAGGQNNSDTISSATIDFTAFQGGAAVAMSESSGTWTAEYQITDGSVDASSVSKIFRPCLSFSLISKSPSLPLMSKLGFTMSMIG